MKNNNDSLYTVYQILTGLFKLSEKIINIKKKLNKDEELKNISEIFVNECNELLSKENNNDDERFMVKSFIVSKKELINMCLKYCNAKTKEKYENNKYLI